MINFSGFCANDVFKQQISCMLEGGRLPHAIVLEGDEGLGKKTLAKIMAAALLCSGGGEKPCGSCPACKKNAASLHPDLFFHDGAETDKKGKKQAFSVDIVRELKNGIIVPPNESNYRVYILANAQHMTTSAQNAILKILEEPPSYAVFVFTVDSKTNLLDTVLSRSLVVRLSEPDVSVAADFVAAKLQAADYQQVLDCAVACGGNIGKTLQSIDDDKFAKRLLLAQSISTALLSGSEYELMKHTAAFEKNNDEVRAVCPLLSNIFRDALVMSAGVQPENQHTGIAADMAMRLGKAKILKLIAAVNETEKMLQTNTNNTLLITKMCYCLRRALGR